ncbi:hypothetical protein IMG5_168710 [Ichthyophthirius multifiliis]|uniref:Uncharacterized protein n=1 Tax=Ichthyophthirius multifiliis TaxID=5932 RepID=G0R168_ICHMU|nr:hypothetical protein IMG5_168710 [Ichthyophthirius multifiliis]EGR28835.1 hypothetical protein IMG5_168710 [Ichthyophthirius multifiliis]|eukprot:XP_004030071.1 hypothetical protein IMG5_168710 [Ichthyophthirius multifiliis]
MADQKELKTDSLFDNLRKLINIVDELRDCGLQQYIQLPRIAVVGSQSSGKSSLLENVVGLDFLPRGSGVVTRRPLELRLVHVPENERQIKPYAVFDNDKTKKFDDFDKVREQIDLYTDQVAGKKKGIVNIPIIMTVYSNDVLDLTIIDLPGITRIPLKDSDHPQNIEQITKDMAMTYIKDERTIILCVIPGNQDISNSDGLQLARQVDPDGNRTIGVITKLDIMDKGTNAERMILGIDIPLKLGFVGVVNRSQQDIEQKKRVKKAIEEEDKFFKEHPVYQKMDPKHLGTKALTQKLSNVLFIHIRRFLPTIINEIKDKLKECEDRLRDLGPSLPVEQKDKMQLIWTMITDFTENFKNSIKGKYDQRRTDIQQELSAGAVIKMMFNELYEDQIQKGYQATKNYTDRDIQIAIQLHQGDSIPGFPSIDAFLYLINPQLERLKDPALECVTQCYNYLEGLAGKLLRKIFSRFPAVMDEISEITSKVLQQQRDKSREVVISIIESEQGYLFTSDMGYLGHKTKLVQTQVNNNNPNQQQNREIQTQIDSEKTFINELRSRIDVYYNIIIRNVRDSIPKAIGFFLVKAAQEQLQFQIYNEIMRNESSLSSIQEPSNIAEERENIRQTMEVLQKAQRVLKRDPEFNQQLRL